METMRGESQYHRAPAGLLFAVVTAHLAGPWTAVPGSGR
jgi:hypothetical protein